MSKVINTYDQLQMWKAARLTKRPVAICRAHTIGSRTQYRRDGWCVYSPWEATDPNAHWTRNGQKHFGRDPYTEPDWRSGESAALVRAMNWADEKYGPFNWVRNRMGDYVPAELNLEFPLRKRK